MLRPATPLAGLFFFAFALLLLSSLTTPVISGLSLGTFEGSRFGVWGYCSGPQTGSRCSSIEVGYKLFELQPTKDKFSVSEETRHNVSFILIIHPVAAFLSFVCFCMAAATHFHGAGHSPRFLNGLFILTLPTFLISLLAFLVDVLLFIPHVAVGGWFVLASVILLLLGSIVTCGMRRTLISRKARQKRIAENSEMSGEDYYLRQAAKNAALRAAENSPPLSGASDSPYKEKTAVFSSYEPVTGTVILDGPRANQPMNPRRNNYSPPRNSPPRNQMYDRPPPLQVRRNEPEPYRNNMQNEYYDQGPPVRQEATAYNGGSQYRMRGGLTSPTRAYSQQSTGRVGAPPQYTYDQPQRGPRMNGYSNGGNGRGRPGYNPGPPQQVMNTMNAQGEVNPYQANVSDLAYRTNPSPPRMNGYLAPVRRQQQQPGRYDRANHAFSTEEESTGQHAPESLPSKAADAPQAAIERADEITTTESKHENSSTQALIAAAAPVAHRTESQPLPRPTRSMSNPGLPTFMSAQDMPMIPDAFWSAPYPMDKHDVLNRSNELIHQNQMPPPAAPPHPHPPPPLGHDLRKVNSLDSIPLSTGQRSPARSDYSHYTSVSQRGINPQWRPPPPRMPQGPTRFAGPSREQVLLDSNPDFSLPPSRSMYGGGTPGAMRGGGAMGRMMRGGRGGSMRAGMGHPFGPTPASHQYPILIRRTASASASASAFGGSPYGPAHLQQQEQHLAPKTLRTAASSSGIIRDGRYPAPAAVF